MNKILHRIRQLPKLPTPGKVIMQFEWWTIREFDGHHLWLEMNGGEGMAIRKEILMGFLSKLWKRF